MTAEGAAGMCKASFDDVYNRADPREYFKAIRPLSYEIPHHANPVFAALLAALPGTRGRSGVLDLCCSYGINAALLRCGLTLEDLFDRYGDSSLEGLSPGELAATDRDFYTARLRPQAPRMLGLDTADQAIAYASRAGLLDAGWAEDLEAGTPSAAMADGVRDVDLITVTGGVGYITERTFEQLLRLFPADRKPWVAAFVLRMYPYDHIAETLAEHDLITERLAGTTFPQRRFASADERDAALRDVRARGIDTHGKEDDGWYHCDFFLSRPRTDVASVPLPDLLAIREPTR